MRSRAQFVALLCAVLAALAGSPAARTQTRAMSPLPDRYVAALAAAGIAPRNSAVVVRATDAAGALAVATNAATAMSPASTMKLVTTYAALQRLGPAYSWTTEAFAVGSLVDGVLNGSLAIRGSGDPTLVIEQLWLLVHRIRAFGVREIRGDVLLDRSAFESMPYDPEEFDGAESRAYNAGPDALLVNFKALTFDFVPDSDSGIARVLVTPAVGGARIPATVRGAAGPCGDWRSRLRGDISNPLAPRFAGEFPLACGTRSWHVNALEPTPYFDAVFRALWENSGGRWTGRARDAVVPAGARLIATHESRPLAEAVRDINKFSNNVMARQIFLTLGAEVSQRPANATRAADAVRSVLAARGLTMPELVLENGSGLSRIERIAPASLAALLADAWRSRVMPELMSSLPILGVDGTIKGRKVAVGSAHLKTGMLTNVRALAGYVLSSSGRRYVIVAIINDDNARAGQAAHDALLDWVYTEG